VPDPAVSADPREGGSRPTSELEPLDETAGRLNVYSGTVRALARCGSRSRIPPRPGERRTPAVPDELGARLGDYLLDMQEETPGRLEFTTAMSCSSRTHRPPLPPSPEAASPASMSSRAVESTTVEPIFFFLFSSFFFLIF